MEHHKRQLTYYNNKQTELFLYEVLAKASEVFKILFTEEQTAALILIGGYGRGEGGIVKIDDTYRPHNNLDLLYIHNTRIDPKILNKANEELQIISKKYKIGIDMSALSKKKLLRQDGLVISYDMRFGHRTLLGDSKFLEDNVLFSVTNIDPADVRQLLINRGTLLLINRLLLEKETLTIEEQKLIIKHTIKAIIGYGDALLYFHGLYHWSYAQKQTNMVNANNIDLEIKDLYSSAILFRFMPDYDTYLAKDLKAWNIELLEILSKIHMECEKINLSEDTLAWDNYFTMALENKSYHRQHFLQKIKTFFHGLKYRAMLRELNTQDERVSFMSLGGRGTLSLLFPYIAYEIYPEHYESLFKVALNVEESRPKDYLKGFLTLWGQWGDSNFINVLHNYNIDLEKL